MLNKKELSNSILNIIYALLSLYDDINNCILINDRKFNLRSHYVKEISFDKDIDLYLKFYESINKYREELKNTYFNNKKNLYSLVNDSILFADGRIKNINSIYAKIYHYNNDKKEKGEIPIDKCLNDLLGIRLYTPFKSIKSLDKFLNDLIVNNHLPLRKVNASKNGYKAIHLYVKSKNTNFKWEIQFWNKKDEKNNRTSHALHKQGYTKWEKDYDTLIGVVDNATN